MNDARFHIALILSFLLISGCTMSAVAPDAISLTAERTGRNATLILRNESGAPIGYNLCTSALQRRTHGNWIGMETRDLCTMEIRTLESGDSATFDKKLPSDIVSGEYRYTTNVQRDGKPVVLASDSFNVP